MSSQAQRNRQPSANDSEWLEFPDRAELSAASVWDLDYEDETTTQTKRVATNQYQEDRAEPSADEERPRARVLDESQILPSEASFATVELYQQVERTTITGRDQLTLSTDEESAADNSNSRPRKLDVSHVLPGEVSFATVTLNQEITRSYSPIREFFGKSSLDWPKLMVEALLLVLISAGATIVALKMAKQGTFSSNATVSNAVDAPEQQTVTPVIQTESATSNSDLSPVDSSQQKQVNDVPASAPETTAQPEAAIELTPDEVSAPLNSERSQAAAANEIKLKTPRKSVQQEARLKTNNSVSVVETKSRLTKQQPQPSISESQARSRTTPTKTVGVESPRSLNAGVRAESSSSSTNVKPPPPPKPVSTTVPVTGGGQRPRTVTPKGNP